ncbi:hypothetical protein L6R52_03750 [Myxococcota bacterium]|nr:hypothetical protein [Myxococcota bacterium]
MPKLRNLVILGIGYAAGRMIHRAWKGELGLREHPKGLAMMAFEVLTNGARGARRTMRRFGAGTLAAGPLGVSSAPDVGGSPMREHDGSFAREDTMIGDEGVIAAPEAERAARDHEALARYHETDDDVLGPDEPLANEELGDVYGTMHTSSDSYDLEANVLGARAGDEMDGDVLVGEGMDRVLIDEDRDYERRTEPAASYGDVSRDVLEASSSDDEYADLAGDIWPIRRENRENPTEEPTREPAKEPE